MSPTFKQFLEAKDTSFWTEHDGAYSTEASSMKGKPFSCPKCEAPLQQSQMKAERDEGEITLWKIKCPKCSTSLTVFND